MMDFITISALYIEKRLRESGFNYPVKHISYESMSHAMITRIPFGIRLVFKTERQNAKVCELERKKMGKELIEWVDTCFREN